MNHTIKSLFTFLLFIPTIAVAQTIDVNQVSKGVYETPAIPDGNYCVKVTLGAADADTKASVLAESRRLYAENVAIPAGQFKEIIFTVNKRDTIIRGEKPATVHVKANERGKLLWDDHITIKIMGDDAACKSIEITPADEKIPTVWLCGNSTVVDQESDPWASWGQMIPRWFDQNVCFANFAESGEAVATFLSRNRWKKIMSMIQPGDYVIMEFGHNDQKQKYAGAGAYYNFTTGLKTMIDEARAKGATPILVTPTCRRSFDDNGKIKATHADYPEAMRVLAARENVMLIDLQNETKKFYEAMGPEDSKKAFVHYPENTFANQEKALADNTHFNPYGAYEISKIIVEGMINLDLPIINHLRPDYKRFDPSNPDNFEDFSWIWDTSVCLTKPDGN